MDGYVNITLNLEAILDMSMDLRVPKSMTLKELLKTVTESYDLNIEVFNPVARVIQSNEILNSTNRMEKIKNGMMINVEEI